MIRTDREYQEARERLVQDLEIMRLQREEMAKRGFTNDQIELAMEASISFHEQLKDEVKWYEQVKSGDFQPINDIQELGLLIIGLRIFLNLSQKQFADVLGVSEAQVSRDERNEYHGITTDRAQRILEALRSGVEIRVVPPSVPERVLAGTGS